MNRESIQDKMVDMLSAYRKLLPMQRQVIQRCVRQLDAIDNASDNGRFEELQKQYAIDSQDLVQQLANNGTVDSYTLGSFTRSRSDLNAVTKLRKKLGLDLPVENLDIN